MLDVKQIRKDFPILARKINNKPIVYLDSGASSLKPRQVVAAMDEYHEKRGVNIHRGIYRLSEEATAAYEEARRKVARFIGAPHQNGAGQASGVVFTRNATESINLVAHGWGRKFLKKGDEVVLTMMEHHANIVPWLMLKEELGVEIKFVQLTEEGLLNMDNLRSLMCARTRLVAVTQVSNVLGIINPVKEIVEMVKGKPHPNPLLPGEGISVLVDGAQAVVQMSVDVESLGCDWYVFSGHKMLGPTGIGVLWGKSEVLEEMGVYQTGGDMIQEVRVDGVTFKKAPEKFEAGTPNIAGAIGLGAAVDYLESLGTHHDAPDGASQGSVHPSGMDWVREHERELVMYGLEKLEKLDEVRIIGTKDAEKRGGVIAFTVKGVHPHDVAQVLDEDNICIRAGNHCAMPLHAYLGEPATCRVSFGVYNTIDDVDKLVEGLEKVINRFKK